MTDELAMSKDEYETVMNAIRMNHAFGSYYPHHTDEEKKANKYIKYVRPDWDMRDGLCFSIRFDGMGCGHGGKKFGSGYGETVPLYKQIMDWLNDANYKPPILSNEGRGA